MKHLLVFPLMALGISVVAVAEKKTDNKLAHIDVSTVKTTGAKAAVKAHGRIHEALDALNKGDIPKAKKLLQKANDLSAESAKIAVDASRCKEKGWEKYKAAKRKHKAT